MSKLKAYPEYKNSGVEWIGEVPEGWKAVKSSLLFFAKKGANAAQLTKEYCAEHCGEFPVYSGQTENNGIMGNIDTFEFDSHDSAYILSTTVGAKAMSVSYLHGKFSLSQNCMIIGQINSRFPMKFFFYLFDVLFAYERRSIPDHMQPSFRMEDFYSYKILLPPLPEQQAIAAFLDRETAQIDALITRKTRSIELLREKRQAMITHAVTKGLNPNAKMKDSGVEWIGEVPEGWEVAPFFAYGKEKKIRNIGMVENNLLSLSYGNIVRRNIDSNEGLLPESFETYQIVEQDDVVFRLTDLQNDQRSLRTGIVKERGIITSAYVVCYFENVSPRFINYLLRAYDTLKVFYGMGGGLRQSMKYEDLKWIPLVIPQNIEQQTIAAYLDEKFSAIDTLIAKTERSIELLKEKRQALITAAVTGKIDVREAAPEVA